MNNDHIKRDDSEDFDARTSSARPNEGPPLKLLALLVVVAALAIFFFQNGDDAPVRFLWIDGEWPVWMVIGVSVLAGIVVDRLGTWQWRRSRRARGVGER